MNDIHPIVGASSPPNFYRTFLPSSENLTAFEELRDACSFYNKHEGLDDWHFQNLFAARQAKRGNGAVVMEEGEVEGTNGDWQEDMDIDSAIGNGRKVEAEEKDLRERGRRARGRRRRNRPLAATSNDFRKKASSSSSSTPKY